MAWLKRIYACKWVRIPLEHLLGIGAVGAMYGLIMLVLGDACPTFAIFGICCPFCGMTRAHIAAFSLDFATALYCHPMFYCAIPFIWLLTHEFFFKRKWGRIVRSALIFIILIALIGVWIWRVSTLGFRFFG